MSEPRAEIVKGFDLVTTKSLISLLALVIVATVSTSAFADIFIPVGDPTNTGNWSLVENMSDEFIGSQLDTAKWHVQGAAKDGVDNFYYSNFIGRAPSQFSTNNVRVENGNLKIQTKYDPSFSYSSNPGQGGYTYGSPPITTAAVISKNEVHYGYMEIRAKAANASISSSFWMTGNHSELDVFEFLGNPSLPNKTHLKSELWSSIHDWSPGAGGATTWTDRLQLGWNVADDFHVYGVEWNENYLKFHADGNLVRTVLRADVGEAGWTIINPLRIWVDSEAFPWHGLPLLDANNPSVDYEVDYIRVWQQNAVPEPTPVVWLNLIVMAIVCRRTRH